MPAKSVCCFFHLRSRLFFFPPPLKRFQKGATHIRKPVCGPAVILQRLAARNLACVIDVFLFFLSKISEKDLARCLIIQTAVFLLLQKHPELDVFLGNELSLDHNVNPDDFVSSISKLIASWLKWTNATNVYPGLARWQCNTCVVSSQKSVQSQRQISHQMRKTYSGVGIYAIHAMLFRFLFEQSSCLFFFFTITHAWCRVPFTEFLYGCFFVCVSNVTTRAILLSVLWSPSDILLWIASQGSLQFWPCKHFPQRPSPG